MRENRCSYLRVLLLSSLEYNLGAKSAHPTKNDLGSSTSWSETDIPAKALDEQSHTSQLQSAPRNHQRLPLGTASASLAQHHKPLEPLHHPHWLSLALRNSWLPLCGP